MDRFLERIACERRAEADGFRAVAGVDEVGRGALAGPLVAAAVILPPASELQQEPGFWDQVRDSKTISHAKRVNLAQEIRQRARYTSIHFVTVDDLDEVGVGAANRRAMEFAVRHLGQEPDLLLIDAMTIDHHCPQVGIIDGDVRSVSIAAASIVAKVARDQVMCDLDRDHPGSGFAKHKGYGAAAHLAAIATLGPCILHRRSFAPIRLALESLDVGS
jgi:ribonuclease HII